MQFIEAGRAACVSMYEIIDRKPAIDASRPGTILENVSVHSSISIQCVNIKLALIV
jgi:hypothetical protein